LVDSARSRERGGPRPLAAALPGIATSGDQAREVVFLVGAEIVPVVDSEGEPAQNGES